MLSKERFIFAHQIGDRGFYPAYKKLLQSQWEPYSVQKKAQEKQLKHIIRFAYDNVPYYHSLFKKLSLAPSDINSVKDLEKLPILTKDIIKGNWDDFKAVNLKKLKYYVYSTGGSTGTPLQYRLLKYDRFFGGAMLYRGWGYAGYNLGDKMALLAGTSLDIGSKSFIIKKANEISRNLKFLSAFDMNDYEMKKYVGVINSFKPKFIRGYVSSIDLFSKYIKNNDLNIESPLALFTTAEKLYPHIKQRIADVFNSEVYDGYGLNDGGVSAYECKEHNGLHIDTERSIMEIVSDDGEQLDSGIGGIVATTLLNYAMPFIRYKTGDLGYLIDDACSCGRGSKLLKEVVGRDKELLITPTGKYVHGAAFYNDIIAEFEDANDIIECQIIQKSNGCLVFNMICDNNFNMSQLERIKKIVKKRNDGWDLEFRFVERIDRTNAGKYKFIINEIRDEILCR